MTGKDKGSGNGEGAGQHRRDDPPLSGGTPPPGNSDGQVQNPGSGSGKRRK
jgi:hypothetical protein